MALLDQTFALQCLSLLLRGTARFCLRHGLRLQDLIESAKDAFVFVAREDLKRSDGRSNTSRISAMTGVHRRDVVRLEKGLSLGSHARDVVTKVLGHWRSAPAFTTKEREPRTLTCEGSNSEFAALVREVSVDLNPGTVLFELERVGAITRTRNGVRARATSYVPHGDPLAGFGLISKDGEDLFRAGEENVLSPQALPHFHARTEFDNVRPEGIEHLKRWFLREGHEFHSRARAEISAFDQDINPDEHFKGPGTRVVLGAYSYVEVAKKK